MAIPNSNLNFSPLLLPSVNPATGGIGSLGIPATNPRATFNPGMFTQSPENALNVRNFNSADFSTGAHQMGQPSSNALGVREQGGLGNKKMNFQTKLGLGVDIAGLGIGSLLGIQQQRLAQKQFKANQRLANLNLQRQEGAMRGELSREYGLAAHPELLAENKDAYLQQYGLR